MEQIVVISLLGWRCAKVLESLVRVVVGIDPIASPFVTKGRIGNDIIKSFYRVTILEEWIGQRVTLFVQRWDDLSAKRTIPG